MPTSKKRNALFIAFFLIVLWGFLLLGWFLLPQHQWNFIIAGITMTSLVIGILGYSAWRRGKSATQGVIPANFQAGNPNKVECAEPPCDDE